MNRYFIFVIFIIFWNCTSQYEDRKTKEEMHHEINENLTSFSTQVRRHQTDSTLSFVFATDLHNMVYNVPYSINNAIIWKIDNLAYAINKINESAMDIVTIDRDKRQIYFDRWGFGANRIFSY